MEFHEIVSVQLDMSGVEVSADGERLILYDPAVITAVKALAARREDGIVTVSVATRRPPGIPSPGKTLGERLKINRGCKTPRVSNGIQEV